MNDDVNGYISLYLSKQSEDKIRNYLITNGVKNVNIDLHTTIIHDDTITTNPLTVSEIEDYHKSLGVITATVTKGDVFGEVGGKWRGPVAILSSPKLVNFHNYLIEKGYHHKFPTYDAHISLSYGADEKDVQKCLTLLNNLQGLLITYDTLIIEPIK